MSRPDSAGFRDNSSDELMRQIENLRDLMALKDRELLEEKKRVRLLQDRIRRREQELFFCRGQLSETKNRLYQVLSSKTWRIGQIYGRAVGIPSLLRAKLSLVMKRMRGEQSLDSGVPDKIVPDPILAEEIPEGALIGNRCDIVFFPMIDFSFRYQRPQQLATYFAENGHRVFYLNTTQFLPPEAKEDFTVSEIKENVFEVFLKSPERLDVYAGDTPDETLGVLCSSLNALRRTWGLTTTVGIVHNPFWTPLALRMRKEQGWRILYDCLDEWSTFGGIGKTVLDRETELVKEADAVTVTAELLYKKWRGVNHACTLVRNACDYEHFRKALPNGLLAHVQKPVIGFFGGIADWIDIDLIRHAAVEKREWSFVLLGGIFTDVSSIEKLPNVFLFGNQPYEKMPSYLFNFDACLIPFKKNKVTEAVDPVKLYEYFSLGKPVVARDLHEIRQYKDHLYLYDSREEFIESIGRALKEHDPSVQAKRKVIAASNTWNERVRVMEGKIRETYKKASIIVVTFNNLELTKACIESICLKTDYPDFEVIIVDNNSTDGTPRYLKTLEEGHDFVSIILNEKNLGFAKANNQGIERAQGDYIVLLNNDTVVTKGWLTKFIAYLDRYPDIGLIGPVTNGCHNEARIATSYRDLEEMDRFAYSHTLLCEGKMFDIKMLALYCTAMRREIIERVGVLDEIFGIGMFEDDDYSHRVKLKGYRVVCAEDIFIHHFGMAAFKELHKSRAYHGLFEKNRKLFEEKWGMPWESHQGNR